MYEVILIKDHNDRTIWAGCARPSEENEKRSPPEGGDLPGHDEVAFHGRPWLRMFSPM